MQLHFTFHSSTRRKIANPVGMKFNRWTVLQALGRKYRCLCDCGTIKVVDAYSVRKGTSVSCGCYKLEQAKKLLPKDLSGQRFGRLVAIEPTEKRGADQSVVWLCQCDCENLTKVTSTNLKSGGTRSCGCLHDGANRIDLCGQRFGRLVALEPVIHRGDSAWKCQCDCGKETVVLTSSLRRGLTRSCRCLSIEMTVERSTGPNNWAWRGGVVPQNQMGRSKPEYFAWRDAVLERDGRACQMCGDASSVLVAHHLESWAANPDLRLDVDNGATMCKSCHWDFHCRYGKRNNTRSQFVEYKGRRIP